MYGVKSWREVAEWYEDELYLLLQLPLIKGQWHYVDPEDGDNNRVGTKPNLAVADMQTAYGKCGDGKGDGICIISSGKTTATTTSYFTAVLDWTKWGITVVGVCAPTLFSQRARIANKSTALDLAYLIDVQGSNNSFYNLSLYNGGTTGAGGLVVSGQRNYFGRIHAMGGMGMTTPTVNDFSLKLSGGDENTFEDCIFGNDTFDKGNLAAAELIVQSGCMRNTFRKCEFISWRSAGTTAGMIKLVGGDCIMRRMVFEDCIFDMYRLAGVASEAALVIGDSPNNGHIIFKNSIRHGFTDWAGVATARVFCSDPVGHEAGAATVACNPS